VPGLEMELHHLTEADRHIAEAKQRLVEARARLDASVQANGDTPLLQKSLDTMRDVLVGMEEHRDLIRRTIKDLEAGKL
jgi:hypothetical protein